MKCRSVAVVAIFFSAAAHAQTPGYSAGQLMAGDSTSWLYPQLATFNGTGAAGDATGEVVYVNYGLVEDYAQLDSMGISARGKIAIARYGKSFRGIKTREAPKQLERAQSLLSGS